MLKSPKIQKDQTLIGPPLPDIPWEEKPENCDDIIWRSSNNPIILPKLPHNSIFNSAIVPYKNRFAGVFRCDDRRRHMLLYRGESSDGVYWKIDSEPIKFISTAFDDTEFEYGYDPRVCWIEDRYYVTWCNGYHGPTIGIGYTYDFQSFYSLGNAFLPYNRNGVLFPRKINGNYAMLSRPSDRGHTPFGDIFYSESPDIRYWGNHRFVMGPEAGWQSTKIGPGPVPLETSEGWLLIYHGVLTSCNGFVYSFGAALLDIDKPWEVLFRTEPYILSPRLNYECIGDVPNVVFPCAVLTDPPTNRLAIYYGAADTVTCIAYADAAGLINFIKENSI